MNVSFGFGSHPVNKYVGKILQIQIHLEMWPVDMCTTSSNDLYATVILYCWSAIKWVSNHEINSHAFNIQNLQM